MNTNLLQPTDTNGDGQTSALDALLIINQINSTMGSAEPDLEQRLGFYGDVDGNGQITAVDALRVINQLSVVPALSEPLNDSRTVFADWRWNEK